MQVLIGSAKNTHMCEESEENLPSTYYRELREDTVAGIFFNICFPLEMHFYGLIYLL